MSSSLYENYNTLQHQVGGRHGLDKCIKELKINRLPRAVNDPPEINSALNVVNVWSNQLWRNISRIP